MVATPYTGTLVMRNRMTGEVSAQPFTASDVANAYVTFTNSNNNFIQAPGSKGHIVDITDITVSAAGVDTTQLNIRASYKDTGISLRGGSLVQTINNRISTPIPIVGGSSIQLKQLA